MTYMSEIETVLHTGRTHTVASRGDANERLDIKLSLPGQSGPESDFAFDSVEAHPTAEQLFAGAWSACYIVALRYVAGAKKIELPKDLSVDIEVDLGKTNTGSFLLRARLNVTAPGMADAVVEDLAHRAHAICPYSKATRGNIDVMTNVATS
jgi:osmotically inducible protein OsmC